MPESKTEVLRRVRPRQAWERIHTEGTRGKRKGAPVSDLRVASVRGLPEARDQDGSDQLED